MTRRLLSVTTAIMLVFASSEKPLGVPSFITSAASQAIDPALAANLQNARAAVESAKAALTEAQAKGEGEDVARQALDAAMAQQAAAEEQANAAKAAQADAVAPEPPKKEPPKKELPKPETQEQEAAETPADKPAESEQPKEQTQAPEAEPIEKPITEATDTPDPAPEKPDTPVNSDAIEAAEDVAPPEVKPKKPVADAPVESENGTDASGVDPKPDATEPVEKPEQVKSDETTEKPVEKPAADTEAAAPEGKPEQENPVTDSDQKPEEKPTAEGDITDKPENATVSTPADKEVPVPAKEQEESVTQKPKVRPKKAKEVEVTPPQAKEKPAKEEAGVDAKPSDNAPVAKDLSDVPIEKQIEAAAEKPAAVLPDDVTKAQQESLKAAERVRRAEAKQKRAELIAAAAAGVAVGALLPILGGKVVEDEGDRFVVERNGEYFVRRDESALFRDEGTDVVVENLRGGRTRETVTRPNGTQIVTLRDPGGYVLRRLKVLPNGDEITLFDTREEGAQQFVDYDRTLPPLQVDIPQEQYIVSGGSYDRDYLSGVFLAPPVEQVDTRYSLRNIRENNRIRSKVRRVDLDSITFDTGSATVRQSQVPFLADTAGSLLDVIGQNPQAVFLIEGHTDAVGSEIYNLTLSDRRAETVARILVDAYGVPPENLVVEGYGEQFLKINSQAAERQNRRVTIRNISPLLTTDAR
ncbi:MAG: OmpA family protein [Stappiaceae bacterium]